MTASFRKYPKVFGLKFSSFLITFILSFNVFAQKIILDKNDWRFKKSGDSSWLPATVPGTVHTDLLANKKIEEPFFRTNEKDLQWIDKEDWEYQTTFVVTEDFLKKQNIEIEFEGLDTYADVFINGQKVLTADNMFLAWKAEIKQFLKSGENTLRVYFKSPINTVMPAYKSLGYVVPVSSNDQSDVKVSTYSRKAGYHYGWDWGPRFVTSGIWKSVYLNAWSDLKFEDMFLKQLSLKNQQAENEMQLTLNAAAKMNSTVEIWAENKPILKKEVLLTKGQNQVNLRFDMKNVELWWPNEMGKQKLYNFKVVVKNGNEIIDNKTIKKGFRTIEVVQENGSQGQSFYFKVNGKPVFMKGANYIPQDNFLPRVTTERYAHVINTVAESHMNMLRVWGGGIYENDVFYELCDEKGILVWQDFMFACAMHPPLVELKKSIATEAAYQVKRLRNHPSMALWCGNNEIIGFMTGGFWGEKAPVFPSIKDSLEFYYMYQDIYHQILPSAVFANDPEKFYWSSSPNGKNYDMTNSVDKARGDQHYWGVWWGKVPFEGYNDNVFPFMSEYGFQSFPELETVKTYALPEDYNIESEVMKAHQRSSIGNGTITYYMKDRFIVPQKFEDFLYVGQVLQAEGIRMAIEAHRRAMPYCMGTLFWQIDDCWPVASWSSMDYYGRWKAQQYMAKKAFEPQMVSVFKEGNDLKIYAISDDNKVINAILNVKFRDFEGEKLEQITQNIKIPSNSSAVVKTFDWKALVSKFDAEKTLIEVSLTLGGKTLAINTFFFTNPKNQKLPSPKIALKKIDANTLEISTDKLARYVWLSIPNAINAFSDNYFDLLPGEKRLIKVKSGISFSEKDVKVMHLKDTY